MPNGARAVALARRAANLAGSGFPLDAARLFFEAADEAEAIVRDITFAKTTRNDAATLRSRWRAEANRLIDRVLAEPEPLPLAA